MDYFFKLKARTKKFAKRLDFLLSNLFNLNPEDRCYL